MNKTGWRLSVFQGLSLGQELAEDRTLPHFSVFRKDQSQNRIRFEEDQRERCWKALLLRPEEDREPNEWDLVREHFEKSRSKKVLSIIQTRDTPTPTQEFNAIRQ